MIPMRPPVHPVGAWVLESRMNGDVFSAGFMGAMAMMPRSPWGWQPVGSWVCVFSFYLILNLV